MKKLGFIILFVFLLGISFLYAYSKIGEKVTRHIIAQKEVVEQTDRKRELVKHSVKNEEIVKEESLLIEKVKRNKEGSKQIKAAQSSAATITEFHSKDFIICIDPGHQQKANLAKEPIGPSSRVTKIKVSGGTRGVSTGKPEYVLTLEAANILGVLLERRGFKVVFTRKSSNVNISNRERAIIANQNNADLFIRIHADGSTNKNVKGLSVLTPAKSDPFTKAIFQDSLKSSQFIVSEVKKKKIIQVNGISFRDDMSGFNWSHVPTTLIEMGFMTNPMEDKSLSNRTYLTNLLSSVADGISDYEDYKTDY
jgi:N-acetylmuramoyl-L-alanine amidase